MGSKVWSTHPEVWGQRCHFAIATKGEGGVTCWIQWIGFLTTTGNHMTVGHSYQIYLNLAFPQGRAFTAYLSVTTRPRECFVPQIAVLDNPMFDDSSNELVRGVYFQGTGIACSFAPRFPTSFSKSSYAHSPS